MSKSEPSDDAVAAAALADLPGMGPARLARLIEQYGPTDAWTAVRSGAELRNRPVARSGPSLGQADALPWVDGPAAAASTKASWADIAAQTDCGRLAERLQRGRIGVAWSGHPDYPARLVSDPQPPGVVFWRGDLSALQRPCVALIGTRRCTPDGASIAAELGRDLAGAGVCVVSGLALGIDGAAHAGALQAAGRPLPSVQAVAGPAAPTIGVAASGVDVPYPRRHTRLWERVAASGAVLSETPPGRPAQAWRFPARNRVLAGLVDLVVVVESHERGGSLITVEAALARGIDIRAVPGPVRSAANVGTNRLLGDGPGPVCDAADVLDALGFVLPRNPPAGGVVAHASGAEVLDAEEQAVMAVVGWKLTSLNQIVSASGLSVASAAAALDRLAGKGRVRNHGDWWGRYCE